jgi:hypothetical protein
MASTLAPPLQFSPLSWAASFQGAPDNPCFNFDFNFESRLLVNGGHQLVKNSMNLEFFMTKILGLEFALFGFPLIFVTI